MSRSERMHDHVVVPRDVFEVLERVRGEVGIPAAIRVDQGSKFISRDLDLWAYQRGVTSISRGQARQAHRQRIYFVLQWQVRCGVSERSLVQEPRRRPAKMRGLHSALGNKTPVALMNRSAHHGPP
jgi:putative transposase